MSTVFLNDNYMPMEEAKISPMDRGFLFGDGIYEVIPSYGGRTVGLAPHIERMRNGLAAVEIKLEKSDDSWREIVETLIRENGSGNLGIYIHVSRGTDSKRNHAYPTNVTPTCYAFAFEIPPAPVADPDRATCYRVSTAEDLRWKRCHIKSTSLLGNVMHYQQGHVSGAQETLLYNSEGELTEAAACNVFIVRDGVIATPELDNQKLPGITRFMVVDILRKHSDFTVEERVVPFSEVTTADEVWLTSSSKEIAPVVEIDGAAVGDGKPGACWLAAQRLYSEHKFDY